MSGRDSSKDQFEGCYNPDDWAHAMAYAESGDAEGLQDYRRGAVVALAQMFGSVRRSGSDPLRVAHEELDAIHRVLREVTHASAPDECSALDLAMLVRASLNRGDASPSGRELKLLRAARNFFMSNRIHPDKIEALRVAINEYAQPGPGPMAGPCASVHASAVDNRTEAALAAEADKASPVCATCDHDIESHTDTATGKATDCGVYPCACMKFAPRTSEGCPECGKVAGHRPYCSVLRSGEAPPASLHTNPSAAAWAAEFKKTCARLGKECDEGWMLGWFANAMMAMHDHLASRRSEAAPSGYAQGYVDGLVRQGAPVSAEAPPYVPKVGDIVRATTVIEGAVNAISDTGLSVFVGSDKGGDWYPLFQVERIRERGPMRHTCSVAGGTTSYMECAACAESAAIAVAGISGAPATATPGADSGADSAPSTNAHAPPAAGGRRTESEASPNACLTQFPCVKGAKHDGQCEPERATLSSSPAREAVIADATVMALRDVANAAGEWRKAQNADSGQAVAGRILCDTLDALGRIERGQ